MALQETYSVAWLETRTAQADGGIAARHRGLARVWAINLQKAVVRTPMSNGKVDYESVPNGASIWVTVKDESSPMHGRPILITKRPDGHFALEGGSGVSHWHDDPEREDKIAARRHMVLSTPHPGNAKQEEKGKPSEAQAAKATAAQAERATAKVARDDAARGTRQAVGVPEETKVGRPERDAITQHAAEALRAGGLSEEEAAAAAKLVPAAVQEGRERVVGHHVAKRIDAAHNATKGRLRRTDDHQPAPDRKVPGHDDRPDTAGKHEAAKVSVSAKAIAAGIQRAKQIKGADLTRPEMEQAVKESVHRQIDAALAPSDDRPQGSLPGMGGGAARPANDREKVLQELKGAEQHQEKLQRKVDLYQKYFDDENPEPEGRDYEGGESDPEYLADMDTYKKIDFNADISDEDWEDMQEQLVAAKNHVNDITSRIGPDLKQWWNKDEASPEAEAGSSQEVADSQKRRDATDQKAPMVDPEWWAENKPEKESAGHLGYFGEYEYFAHGDSGQIYRARVTNPVGTDGYREGGRWEGGAKKKDDILKQAAQTLGKNQDQPSDPDAYEASGKPPGAEDADAIPVADIPAWEPKSDDEATAAVKAAQREAEARGFKVGDVPADAVAMEGQRTATPGSIDRSLLDSEGLSDTGFDKLMEHYRGVAHSPTASNFYGAMASAWSTPETYGRGLSGYVSGGAANALDQIVKGFQGHTRLDYQQLTDKIGVEAAAHVVAAHMIEQFGSDPAKLDQMVKGMTKSNPTEIRRRETDAILRHDQLQHEMEPLEKATWDGFGDDDAERLRMGGPDAVLRHAQRVGLVAEHIAEIRRNLGDALGDMQVRATFLHAFERMSKAAKAATGSVGVPVRLAFGDDERAADYAQNAFRTGQGAIEKVHDTRAGWTLQVDTSRLRNFATSLTAKERTTSALKQIQGDESPSHNYTVPGQAPGTHWTPHERNDAEFLHRAGGGVLAGDREGSKEKAALGWVAKQIADNANHRTVIMAPPGKLGDWSDEARASFPTMRAIGVSQNAETTDAEAALRLLAGSPNGVAIIGYHHVTPRIQAQMQRMVKDGTLHGHIMHEPPVDGGGRWHEMSDHAESVANSTDSAGVKRVALTDMHPVDSPYLATQLAAWAHPESVEPGLHKTAREAAKSLGSLTAANDEAIQRQVANKLVNSVASRPYRRAEPEEDPKVAAKRLASEEKAAKGAAKRAAKTKDFVGERDAQYKTTADFLKDAPAKIKSDPGKPGNFDLRLMRYEKNQAVPVEPKHIEGALLFDNGNLAVHPSIANAGQWTVTHVPTGFYMPVGESSSKEAAQAKAHALMSSGVDWSKVTVDGIKDTDTLQRMRHYAGLATNIDQKAINAAKLSNKAASGKKLSPKEDHQARLLAAKQRLGEASHAHGLAQNLGTRLPYGRNGEKSYTDAEKAQLDKADTEFHEARSAHDMIEDEGKREFPTKKNLLAARNGETADKRYGDPWTRGAHRDSRQGFIDKMKVIDDRTKLEHDPEAWGDRHRDAVFKQARFGGELTDENRATYPDIGRLHDDTERIREMRSEVSRVQRDEPNTRFHSWQAAQPLHRAHEERVKEAYAKLKEAEDAHHKLYDQVHYHPEPPVTGPVQKSLRFIILGRS